MCQSLKLFHNIFSTVIFNSHLIRSKNAWIKRKCFHLYKMLYCSFT